MNFHGSKFNYQHKIYNKNSLDFDLQVPLDYILTNFQTYFAGSYFFLNNTPKFRHEKKNCLVYNHLLTNKDRMIQTCKAIFYCKMFYIYKGMHWNCKLF